jgi:hypothetical protein
VPTGKPDGSDEAATEDVGVEGLSVSVLVLVLVLERLPAGWASPSVDDGELCEVVSILRKGNM